MAAKKVKEIEINKVQLDIAVPELIAPKPTNAPLATTTKHLANLGDIVSTFAACKKYYEVTKRKIIYCQCVDTLAAYYPGATHPTTDLSGNLVTLNDKMFEMVKPLVEAQEWCQSFQKYSGQKIDLNFDVIRGQTNVNMPHGMLAAWLFYAFPDLACDLSEPYLILPEMQNEKILAQVKGKVIINFTERYRNNLIDYFFLQNYAPDLIFSGTEKEHFLFCNRWGLNIPNIVVDNFLELAYALKECRFLLGNQSFHWNISESQKTPRILEVCPHADNCQPNIGKDSYGYFYQVGAEYYWRKLYNETFGK